MEVNMMKPAHGTFGGWERKSVLVTENEEMEDSGLVTVETHRTSCVFSA